MSPTDGIRNSRMRHAGDVEDAEPASTVPAVLAGAEISRTSSMAPTA